MKESEARVFVDSRIPPGHVIMLTPEQRTWYEEQLAAGKVTVWSERIARTEFDDHLDRALGLWPHGYMEPDTFWTTPVSDESSFLTRAQLDAAIDRARTEYREWVGAWDPAT